MSTGLIRKKQPIILNSSGQPIVLNREEKAHASWMQRQLNERFANAGLGYEIPVTTLTTIVKKVSEQKFFEVAPADYMPVVAGQGAWSSNLTTYRSFDIADQFETGIVNTGSNNTRMASADAAVDALNIQVYNWVKSIGWSVFDLQQAVISGNWDLVSAKEESRKKNWDLGIQRIAFLGARGLNGTTGTCQGLLNQTGVVVNTSVITQSISSMSSTQLASFVATVIEAYRSNCNRTAMPTKFVVPESDYNGMAAQASPTFPMKSILQLLEEAFQLITRKPGFKIMPLAYGDAGYHADVSGIVGKQVYVLLNEDEKSLRMDIPVDYTPTMANSLDNFNFQNAAYGQFTGVLAYRPLEMLYFQF